MKAQEFLNRCTSQFEFSSLSESERQELMNEVLSILNNSSSDSDTQKALSVIRILSRDKQRLSDISTPEILFHLLKCSGLTFYRQEGESVLLLENMALTSITEALKALSNLVFNAPHVVDFCVKEMCVFAILQRMKTYCDPAVEHDVKFFDLRLLFILTALNRESCKIAALQWSGVRLLSEVLTMCISKAKNQGGKMADAEVDLVLEALKSLFNLTSILSGTNDSALVGDLARLAIVIDQLLITPKQTKDKQQECVKHCINLLTNMPEEIYSEIIPEVSEMEPELFPPESSMRYARQVFMGHDIRAITEMLMYLETSLESIPLQSQKEVLLPVFMVLTAICRANRYGRKFCRLRVLPHLRDEVKRLPEEGDTLRNKLCKLLTTPNNEIKLSSADFLFVLCKEDVTRFIKYSGFGNAAGLLAQYGLMSGRQRKKATYSDDSDSDTEEYKELEPNVNAVTGRWELPKPNPMDNMTEEQMEYETHQLLNAMDKLQRIGIVQPSRIGSDGRPQPLEHVLELVEAQESPACGDDSTQSD